MEQIKEQLNETTIENQKLTEELDSIKSLKHISDKSLDELKAKVELF